MTPGGKKFRLTMSSFNVIKGLCMVGVVLGHMAFRYPVEEIFLPFRLIYFALYVVVTGAMPMFFLISGYGFKEKPAGKFLKTSFQGLIKPYCLVMLAFAVVFPVTFRLWYGQWRYGFYEELRYLAAFLLGIAKPGKVLFGHSLHHCSAVWFFLASFWASNFLNLVLKLKNEKLRIFAVAVLAVAGYLLLKQDINYFCIGQGCMATGYYYLGYILKKHDLFSRWMGKAWTYIVLIPVTAFFTLFCSFDLAQGAFRFGMVDYAASFFSGLLLMYIGVGLQRIEGKVFEVLDTVGIYTYWILCIHVVENDGMQWWAFKEAIPNINAAYAGELVLKGIIIVCGCMALKKISQRKYKRRRMEIGK